MLTSRHVVIINDHGYVSGGAAVVALEQALDLRRVGHRVTWVCFSRKIDQRLIDSDINVVNWPVPELSAPRALIPNLFNGIFNIYVFFRLLHLFKNWKNIRPFSTFTLGQSEFPPLSFWCFHYCTHDCL